MKARFSKQLVSLVLVLTSMMAALIAAWKLYEAFLPEIAELTHDTFIHYLTMSFRENEKENTYYDEMVQTGIQES